MRTTRALPSALLALSMLSLTPHAVSGRPCTTVRDRVVIRLSNDSATKQSGTKLGDFDCWMPKPPSSQDKDLCQDDVSTAHAFWFELRNDCAMAVRLKLQIRGGGSLRFQEPQCAGGANVFDDYVAAGSSMPRTCTSTVEPGGSGDKSSNYDLRATHVRVGTGPAQPIARPVEYDPEISVKDGGRSNIGAGVVIGLVLGVALLVWVLLRYFGKSSARR